MKIRGIFNERAVSGCNTKLAFMIEDVYKRQVYYHIGEGYAHTFLNGITLFAWNGQKANIIAQKFWGGCNWRCFNERTAKEESIVMLKDFLAGQAKAMGSIIADSQLLAFSRNMIEETQQKLLQ